jgi:hypothetical protein
MHDALGNSQSDVTPFWALGLSQLITKSCVITSCEETWPWGCDTCSTNSIPMPFFCSKNLIDSMSKAGLFG